MEHASLWAHNFDQGWLLRTRPLRLPGERYQAGLASGYVTGRVHAVTGQLDQAKAEIDQALTLSRSGGDVVHQSFATLCLPDNSRTGRGVCRGVAPPSRGSAIARVQPAGAAAFRSLYQRAGADRQGRLRRGPGQVREGLVLSERWAPRSIATACSIAGWLYMSAETWTAPSTSTDGSRGGPAAGR